MLKNPSIFKQEKLTFPKRRVATSVAALIGLAIFGWGCSQNKTVQPVPVKAQNLSARNASAAAITQEQITQEYQNLYDVVKKEKTAADARKENLVILVGEKHDSDVSFLMELMLLDIAQRLGIHQLAEELDSKNWIKERIL